MFEAIVRRLRTSSSWLAVALVVTIAVPVTLRSQARQGQPGVPPGAPGAPGAPAPGQGRGGQPAGGPGRGAGAAAKDGAPVDLTGYWVSIVTEDWIERMSPDSPRSGTDDGRGGGRAGGGGGGGRGGGRGGGAATSPSEPCRAYAAGGSLRVPGRLNISWADDNTLKVDMDAGTQTRLLKFNTTVPAGTPKTLQGFSVASWETGARGGGFGGGFGGGGGGQRGGTGRGGAAPPRWGSLKVVTTNMTGGYLLSSRSSYSENATLTEHFTRHADFGVEYFTVTAIVEDGGGQSITSSTFKKEPDGSKFKPTGCEVVR